LSDFPGVDGKQRGLQEPVLHNSSKRKNKKIKSYIARLKELGIEGEIKQVSKKNKRSFFTGQL
jgi:hypothetical protein